jgi:hypothetical protein
VILAGIDPGEAVALAMQVQPLGGGTTTPPPGTQQVLRDSVIPVKATPNPGFRFTGWSPNVTDPAKLSTTVFMDTSQTVTANFQACACAVDVSTSIGIRISDALGSTHHQVQIATLTNNSANTISGPFSLVLDNLTDNVTLSNASGSTLLMVPAGSPYIDAPLKQLKPGQWTTFTLLFANPDGADFSYTTRVLAGPGAR